MSKYIKYLSSNKKIGEDTKFNATESEPHFQFFEYLRSNLRYMNKKNKLIEIQREIDRKMGNEIILDKIRSGEYRLRTGEALALEDRPSFYSDRFDKEFEDIVKYIDQNEKLDLNNREMKGHANELKLQMDEGRDKLTMRIKEKDGKEKSGESGKEKKRKKSFF
ncbi:MAG: hypothetical protein U9M90_04405 [Patescibacteria group bacterium]|nr:hypothetical protein [Patescibacteria group bacterium]